MPEPNLVQQNYLGLHRLSFLKADMKASLLRIEMLFALLCVMLKLVATILQTRGLGVVSRSVFLEAAIGAVEIYMPFDWLVT